MARPVPDTLGDGLELSGHDASVTALYHLEFDFLIIRKPCQACAFDG